jgi:hypothetical protein
VLLPPTSLPPLGATIPGHYYRRKKPRPSPIQSSALTFKPKLDPSLQKPIGPRATPLPYFTHFSGPDPTTRCKYLAQARPAGILGLAQAWKFWVRPDSPWATKWTEENEPIFPVPEGPQNFPCGALVPWFS